MDLALDATPSGVVGGHIYTNQGYQNRPKFTTGAGRSYQIERTTNFVNWTDVTASLITATGGTTSFTNSATAAAGFFRVRVVGP